MFKENMDIYEVFTEIENTLESVKTLAVRQKDDQTTWLDTNDDNENSEVVGFVDLIMKLGFVALYNWDEIRDLIGNDIREELEMLMVKQCSMTFDEDEE